MKTIYFILLGTLLLSNCGKSEECPYGTTKKPTSRQTNETYIAGKKNGTLYKPSFFQLIRKDKYRDSQLLLGDYDICGYSDYVFFIYFPDVLEGTQNIQRGFFTNRFGDPSDSSPSTVLDSLDTDFKNTITFDKVQNDGIVEGSMQLRLLIKSIHLPYPLRTRDTIFHLEDIRFRIKLGL